MISQVQNAMQTTLQNLKDFELTLDDLISPEQQENIANLISDLQTSIDSPPSRESLELWQTTVLTAIEDGEVTIEEAQAIGQATVDVFSSVGLTGSEVRTIAYDLQDIAEASQLPSEDEQLFGTEGNDLLWGKTGSDSLTGTSGDGQGEIDLLVGGGGSDTFVLGDTTTVYYDDGLALTAGLDDFAAIADFNIAYDTIQLHGDASNYSLGSLPEGAPMQGTAIYHVAGGQMLELIGIISGVEVMDFSQGFTFVS